ncbi:hypothetical protein IT398_01895 [Candidatus Nomurabacteria bacterium]|nr:hypothetical protein [Candidatus Nomurabacteria bacterium]
MDRETQTSFIPKAALSRNMELAPRSVSFFTVISMFTLFLSIAFWGGTFGYRQILQNQIEAPCSERSTVTGNEQSCGLRESINRERQNLDQATTVFLKRLSDKLLIGNDLVRTHQTVLPLLTMLEELTLPSIYYTRFAYNGKTITIEGRASGYEDIAVQTQVLSRDRGRIKSFIFSDLDLDSFGNVIFRLILNVEPEVISYTHALGDTTINNSSVTNNPLP